jgi:putative SOS response-associated peptidase YedK
MQPIHNRIPVIVKKDYEGSWIDTDNNNQKELLDILKLYSSEEMMMSTVDPNLLYKPKAQENAFSQSEHFRKVL